MPAARLEALKPYERNARTHSRKQIQQIATSIQQFGFVNPILIDTNSRIIAGHGRVEAARGLGLVTVPTLCLDHLSEPEKRAYIIADNRLAELAGWDRDILAIEFQHLLSMDLEFDIDTIGFDLAEIEVMIEPPGEERAEPSLPKQPLVGETATLRGVYMYSSTDSSNLCDLTWQYPSYTLFLSECSF